MRNEYDAKVCVKNLDRATRELLHAEEKRRAHLYELLKTSLPAEKPASVQEAAALFEAAAPDRSVTPDPGSPFADSLGTLTSVTAVSDGVAAASFIRWTYGIGGDIREYTERVARVAERPGRISYFRSPAADAAFDIFAARIPDPSVSYGADFATVCENVYYGRAEFCILPVSNGADGRLSGFYALAEKYELTGADECRVTYGDGETDLVLFSAGVLPHADDGKLRIRLKTPHNPDTLFILSCAASRCGTGCDENDSLPTGYGRSDMLTFSGEREKICDLLFYLCCAQISFDITGVFGYEDV